MIHLGDFDVIVIGAGHAGIEAAHAAAVLGAHTGLFTLSLDGIGNMPCNPSIGGTAKGHLVREVDALGGVMGLAADATYLQSRMLNRGKGPAVHSLRVQTDRRRYHDYMKLFLERTPGMELKQAEVTDILAKTAMSPGCAPVWTGTMGQSAWSSPPAPTWAARFLWAGRTTPAGRTASTPHRPDREPESPGPAAAPVQDRHPGPGTPAQH